ncbi:MAG TPA: DUF3048 domain-containing protein [Acidimicrobiales bacterium]|nr:DUF3048 domain-containing protein [Acidimicrobiales bacterium]
MRKTTRSRALALAVPLVLAITAACGGGGGDKAAKASTGPATTTSLAPNAVFPLTGVPTSDAARAGRPAVAVKIDNSADARPQAGIDHADIVYEEYTEGITRFIVVFQSSDAPTVGPVRSVRPADPNVIAPLRAALAFSGGSPGVLDVVKASGVRQITENDTDTLKRRAGKAAPHNLYTTTDALFHKVGAGSPPPAFGPFLLKGQVYAATGATPATHLSLSPGPDISAAYQWDPASGTWKRSTDGKPHALEGGGQISPTNIVVQYTPYSTFPADKKVRFPEVVGSGDALIFAAGTMTKAKWTKAAVGSVTTYVDSAGKPITLPPGQTWIHLLEPGAALTSG